ncbi:MAG TPA: XRE family transcriptional regulator [Terrisporobacter glycolicus]|uniref:helix-turn-helix domain-containing protein n=1 Tax=Terrisporobacter TaxID=1505652 RepID=UPI000E8B3D21|nr:MULTISPECIES: helix-turn-helix transcriptional regulator [Terrisporobacter]HBI91260.1 XRE family transcriptional regulator [Terrisporobacter hibernicus]
MDKTFGKRLKSLRIEKDLNQSDLADILELSTSTIGMYEQGRRYADLDTIKKIAEYFDVSVDYLLGRTDIKKFEDFPPEVKRVANLFAGVDKPKADKLEKLIRELLEK